MGFVNDLFDANKGAGFSAQGAPLIQTTDAGQLAQAYGQANKGIHQQYDFLRALQQQNGIGNQANVFAQQQALANQLNQQAQGGGPNPALAQLAQTTGQNISNQAALMAGQRGASVNPGLAARQIAAQGVQANQAAGGQAALMRANQQLAAQQALANQQAQMANLAGGQVNQLGNAINSYGQGAQNQFGALQGAANALNQANVGMQANINQSNAGIAGINAKGQQGMFGGAMNSVGSALAGLAHGGMVGCYADGGMAAPALPNPSNQSGPQSFLGQVMSGALADRIDQKQSEDDSGSGMFQDLLGSVKKGIQGAIESDGGSGLMALAALGGGGKVPGKASVAGDSLANDKVPAMLSPGEVVIPRTKVKDPESTAQFLNALLGYNLKAKGKK